MKLLTVILPVFALVFIGWTAQRLRLMEPSALRGLRDLVFFLAMPALLFSAIETAPPFDLVSVISVYFAAALSIFAFAFVVARLLGMSLAKAAMLSLNSSYGNTVLMGIPIIVAALGEDALQLRGEGEIGFVLVFAALRASRRSLGSVRCALLFAFSSLLLLFFGADDLLDPEGMGAPLGHINEGNGEEGQTGKGAIEDRGEEPADPIGMFA